MSTLPRVITCPDEARAWVRSAQQGGQSVGLVPTMGALHAGHVSLVQAARAACDLAAATIFVNPTQFAPHEDFDRYPRTLDADCSALAGLADVVFAPPIDAMYPAGFSTYVAPPAVAEPWEGACRPGHFRGVCTVVLKLFQMLPADDAFFGRKDYQQAVVLEHMARDLSVPVRLHVCPTVRDADGLAMSSRNVYLSADERMRALAICRGLQKIAALVEAGETSATALAQELRGDLMRGGVEKLDYAVIVDPATLKEVDRIDAPCMALVAGYVGSTRLLDNWPLAAAAGSAPAQIAPA